MAAVEGSGGGGGGGGHGSWDCHESLDGVQIGMRGEGGVVGERVFFIYFLAVFFVFVFSLGLHTCTRTRERWEGVWKKM